MNSDAGCMLNDAGGDFDELRTDCHELGLGERTCCRDGVAHCQHEPVGGGVQSEHRSFCCASAERTEERNPYARSMKSKPGRKRRSPIFLQHAGRFDEPLLAY